MAQTLTGKERGDSPPRPISAVTGQALSLDAIRDPDAIHQLEPEWRALMAAASQKATIYQSYDWAAACVRRLPPRTEACILTVRASGRLLAVAPMMIDRLIGLKTMRWLGGSRAIYGDVLADDAVDIASWLDRAFRELGTRSHVHSLQLENVRADARIAPYLEGTARKTVARGAPAIDLAAIGSFEAWRASQSRTTRRSRSRRVKQLHAAGRVSFAFEPVGPSASERIATLLAMKRDWAESRGIISRTIDDPDFEGLVNELAAPESCLDARYSELSLDDKAIAIELGFVADGIYVSYLGAYDRTYEAFSPGMLQLENTLEACFAEGIKRFDLQPPADAYKLSLANCGTEVSSYSLALTRPGIAHGLVADADPVGLARALIDKMPARVRHVMSGALRRHRSASARTARPAKTNGLFKPALVVFGAGCAIAASL
ncbi:MAG TPA: GNAT family N-acetyltransferase [Hyphomicrobiaceae bacterium]|nr:GNAT family N-acetyltransferase [Hyphomicrobiaceae bacterium]